MYNYLSNLPADTPLKKLAGAIKARWVCEQAINSSRKSSASTTSQCRSANHETGPIIAGSPIAASSAIACDAVTACPRAS
jgi:hypothetical protein